MAAQDPLWVIPTTEVRWFQKGEPPSSWTAWFESCPGPWQDEPPRTDAYLTIDDTDSLGIKFREGRLEIKQRLESWGILRLNDQVQGLVEHWTKWSFAIGESVGFPAEFNLPESNWINVHKRRKLRRYQLSDRGQLAPLAADEDLPHLCEVELTGVWLGEQAWWSLAFEAPGPQQASYEVLLAVARQLLDLEGAPRLLAPDSYGYARWLRR